MKNTIFLCIFFVFHSINSYAQCYNRYLNEGIAAFQDQDYEKAIRKFEAAKICEDQPSTINELLNLETKAKDKYIEEIKITLNKTRTKEQSVKAQIILNSITRELLDGDLTRAYRLVESAYLLDSTNTTAQDMLMEILEDCSPFYSKLDEDKFVKFIKIFPSGNYFITVNYDLIIWDIKGNKILNLKCSDLEFEVAIAPDEKSIAISDFKGIRLFNIDGSNKFDLPPLQNCKANAISFSPNGKFIIVACNNKNCLVFDLKGNIVNKFSHLYTVNSIEFASGNSDFISASQDSVAFLWNLDGKIVTVLKHKTPLKLAISSPNGKIVLTATEHKKENSGYSLDKSDKIIFTIWDTSGAKLKDWELKSKYLGRNQNLYSISFTSDSKSVFISSYSYHFRMDASYYLVSTMGFWDMQGVKFCQIKDHKEELAIATYSPTRNILISASLEDYINEQQNNIKGGIKFWNIDFKEQLKLNGLSEKINYSEIIKQVNDTKDGITIWELDKKSRADLQLEDIKHHDNFIDSSLVETRCFQKYFNAGANEYKAYNFENAIKKFKAAKICPRNSEAEIAKAIKWIKKAKNGHLESLKTALLEYKNKEFRTKSNSYLALISDELIENDPTSAFNIASAAYHQDTTNKAASELMIKIFNTSFPFYSIKYSLEAIYKFSHVDLSQGGEKIAVNYNILNLPDETTKSIYAGYDSDYNFYQFSNNEQFVLGLYSDGLIRIWGIDGELKDTVLCRGLIKTKNYSAIFSPDDSCFLVEVAYDSIYLYTLEGKKIGCLKLKESILNLDFAPDGNSFLVAYKDSLVTYNLKFDKIKKYPIQGQIKNAKFSFDGDHIKILEYNMKGFFINIINIKGNLIETLNLNAIPASSKNFFVSTKFNLIGFNNNDNNNVMVYDVNRKKVIELKGHQYKVKQIIFPLNEKFAITVSSVPFEGSENTIRYWSFLEKSEKDPSLIYDMVYNNKNYGAISKFSKENIKENDVDFAKVYESNDIEELIEAADYFYEKKYYKTYMRFYLDYSIELYKKAYELAPNKVNETNIINAYEALLDKNLTNLEKCYYYKEVIFYQESLFEKEGQGAQEPVYQLQGDQWQVVQYINYNKRQLSSYYGILAWYQILNEQYIPAIESAKKGLSYNTEAKWINTNLALGLLLDGQFEKARMIYEKYMDVPWKESGSRSDHDSFREVFLDDLNAMKLYGLNHPDIFKIKKILLKE